MNRRTIKKVTQYKQDHPGSKSEGYKSTALEESSEYLNSMFHLLNKIEPNKIIKMVNSIKSYNHAFETYINQNRLIAIKYEDVTKFESLFKLKTQKLSHKQKREMQAIKIGFQELKNKMEEFQVTDFISQINYTSAIIQRELTTLSKSGHQYQGLFLLQKPYNSIAQLELSEKQNGIYSAISSRTIEKLKIVDIATNDFYQSLKKQ